MWNLENYESVDQRLEKFWIAYPDGRIDTEIEHISENRVIIKAYIYKTFADGVAFATGFAEEERSTSGVNKTSFVENCESSAIGRALHNGGISKHSEGKPRPSKQEMEKVKRIEEASKPKPKISGGEEMMDQDVWASAVGTIAETLKADVIESAPMCSHGDMALKEGTNKFGKPYHGYVCTAPKDEQCKPIWYQLSPSGSWILQDSREK